MSDWSIDRVTRELSGAMWTFFRLPDDGSAATFIHRCFQRGIWHEVKLQERIVMLAALPLVPLVVVVLAAVFTTINGQAIKKRTGKGIIRQIREQIGVRSGARFCLPGTISSNCMTTISSVMPRNT